MAKLVTLEDLIRHFEGNTSSLTKELIFHDGERYLKIRQMYAGNKYVYIDLLIDDSICQDCRSTVDSTDKFCRYCGHDLGND